jgi:hypothetical protein
MFRGRASTANPRGLPTSRDFILPTARYVWTGNALANFDPEYVDYHRVHQEHNQGDADQV